MFLRGELYKDMKNSNFQIFESTLYIKSGSMLLSNPIYFVHVYKTTQHIHFRRCTESDNRVLSGGQGGGKNNFNLTNELALRIYVRVKNKIITSPLIDY